MGLFGKIFGAAVGAANVAKGIKSEIASGKEGNDCILGVCSRCGSNIYDWDCEREDFEINGMTSNGHMYDITSGLCGTCAGEDYLDDNPLETDDIFDLSFDSEGDEPECCAACGGPYPHCQSSCSLFDD